MVLFEKGRFAFLFLPHPSSRIQHSLLPLLAVRDATLPNDIKDVWGGLLRGFCFYAAACFFRRAV